jgi:hypothetical protein
LNFRGLNRHEYWGGTTVDQIVIYSNGIVLDTRLSTDDSKALLLETLNWANRDLSLTYRDGMIKQTHFLSQLTFCSKAPLQNLHPGLNRVSEKVTDIASRRAATEYKYEVTGITINFDQLTAVRKPFAFTLERRENTPFSENKYFSAAPLETKDHIGLIEGLEADLGI